jgi:hypothetical protein
MHGALTHVPVVLHYHRRISQKGIEDLLDIIADVEELPPAFRDSIANNHRALLTALDREWGLESSCEIVYAMCPDCGWVFRNTTTRPFDPDADECPKCCAACFTTTDGKRQPRMQVCECCCV